MNNVNGDFGEGTHICICRTSHFLNPAVFWNNIRESYHTKTAGEITEIVRMRDSFLRDYGCFDDVIKYTPSKKLV